MLTDIKLKEALDSDIKNIRQISGQAGWGIFDVQTSTERYCVKHLESELPGLLEYEAIGEEIRLTAAPPGHVNIVHILHRSVPNSTQGVPRSVPASTILFNRWPSFARRIYGTQSKLRYASLPYFLCLWHQDFQGSPLRLPTALSV